MQTPVAQFIAVCRSVKTGEKEDCGGAWAYMQLVEQHHVPLAAMSVVATTLQRLLKADGQTTIRQIIGDRATFREAVDQLDTYLQFQPERFDRRQVNGQLRAVAQQEGVLPCSIRFRSSSPPTTDRARPGTSRA